jgi:hypothetical protein
MRAREPMRRLELPSLQALCAAAGETLPTRVMRACLDCTEQQAVARVFSIEIRTRG